jgi:hypothetical protein
MSNYGDVLPCPWCHQLSGVAAADRLPDEGLVCLACGKPVIVLVEEWWTEETGDEDEQWYLEKVEI